MSDDLILCCFCRFVGNNFSAADINIEFPVEFSSVLPTVQFSKYKKLSAWLERVKQRAAYQKALKADGNYNVSNLL